MISAGCSLLHSTWLGIIIITIIVTRRGWLPPGAATCLRTRGENLAGLAALIGQNELGGAHADLRWDRPARDPPSLPSSPLSTGTDPAKSLIDLHGEISRKRRPLLTAGAPKVY